MSSDMKIERRSCDFAPQIMFHFTLACDFNHGHADMLYIRDSSSAWPRDMKIQRGCGSFDPERIFCRPWPMTLNLDIRSATHRVVMVDICAKSYENQAMDMEGVSRKRFHGKRRASNPYPRMYTPVCNDAVFVCLVQSIIFIHVRTFPGLNQH